MEESMYYYLDIKSHLLTVVVQDKYPEKQFLIHNQRVYVDN